MRIYTEELLAASKRMPKSKRDRKDVAKLFRLWRLEYGPTAARRMVRGLAYLTGGEARKRIKQHEPSSNPGPKWSNYA